MEDVFASLVDGLGEVGLYVIDERDQTILYYNRCIKEAIPAIEIGKVCRDVVGGPCDDCPLLKIGEKHSSHTLAFHSTYDELIDVTASRVLWKDKTPAFALTLTPHLMTEAEQCRLRLEQENFASHELLSLSLEKTNISEFYYYPLENITVNPQRTCTLYGCKELYENMPESFANEIVAAEHRNAYCEMFRTVQGGEKFASSVVRFAGTDSWCRIKLTIVNWTSDGRPALVVGMAENISKEKHLEIALEQARSRDSLTGLYTKEAGVRKVREYMASRDPAEVCGLMLLDMDNFKPLNDEQGVPFADAVLQDVAAILMEETSEDDIQIRMGGDEFMLFIKGCDKARATIIGPRIADRVKNLLKDSSIDVSVSIGMCVTAVVNEYDGLYHCADSTLQFVKAHTKGTAACYLDTSNEVGTVLTALYTGEHSINSIERTGEPEGEDLLAFALDLLGKSKKLDNSIALLLSRIGRQCGLDRVSVVEMDRKFMTVYFSHQWAKDESELVLGRTIYMHKEDLDELEKAYDSDGLCFSFSQDKEFVLPDCLHAAIYDRCEYVGALLFERKIPQTHWTTQDSKLAREMAKLISSYLMKEKADAVSKAKTDFLSRMSHEIRTPMNAISGMTTIAKTVVQDSEKTLDCLHKIEMANSYLLNIVNDILDMSRIESGRLELNAELVDIPTQMSTIMHFMSAQAVAKGICFSVSTEWSSPRPVVLDAVRLNQVLVNIVGNALKFTPAEGSVKVRVEALQEWEESVSLRFSVRDTGIGIAEQALNRIFNAFEQADRSTSTKFGGTGLGLAISSNLVRMMGGTLEVASSPGKGAEFYFTLTVPYASQSDVAAAVVRDIPVMDFSGKRLLLAEDNELNCEIAVTLLEMNGFSVETAKNGKQALDLFVSRGPYYYDGILMDIQMPVMDGLEATHQIRMRGQEDSTSIPIIAMTANAFDEDSRKSLESGLNGHISKPIEISKMLGVLDSLVGRHQKDHART